MQARCHGGGGEASGTFCRRHGRGREEYMKRRIPFEWPMGGFLFGVSIPLFFSAVSFWFWGALMVHQRTGPWKIGAQMSFAVGSLFALAVVACVGYRVAVWIYRNRQSVCYALFPNGELITVDGPDAAEEVIEVFAGRKSVLYGLAAANWRIIGDNGEKYPRLCLQDGEGGRVSASLEGAFHLVRFSSVASALDAGQYASAELKGKRAALESLDSSYEVLLRRAAWAIECLTLIIGRISSKAITSPSAARKEIEFILDHAAPEADLRGETLLSLEIEKAREALQQLFKERDAERASLATKRPGGT